MTGMVELSAGEWRTHIKRLTSTLLDLILPPACAYCRKAGPLICDNCLKLVARVEEPFCELCGRATEIAHTRCSRCCTKPLPVQQARAALLFVDPIREIIHKFKYEGMYALAQPLSALMADNWPIWHSPASLIVPIPLHPARKRARGFNQSELLANHLGQAVKLPCEPAALRRLRHTRPQVELNPAERYENVAGAFLAEKDFVAGQDVLLVDDVFTTGSTMSEAARALVAVGARSVSGYCLARPA